MDRVHDLVVVPAGGGQPRIVAADVGVSKVDYFLRTYLWHPSRDQLFWVKNRQLWTLDCDQSLSEPAQLAADLGEFAMFPLLTTRDGSALVAGLLPTDRVEGHDIGDPLPTRLALIPLQDLPPVAVSVPEDLQFESVLARDPRTAWEPEPGTVAICANRPDTAEQVLLRLDLDSAQVTQLWEGHAKRIPAGATRDHRGLVMAYQDFNHRANF
jgi:hypothetical protein